MQEEKKSSTLLVILLEGNKSDVDTQRGQKHVLHEVKRTFGSTGTLFVFVVDLITVTVTSALAGQCQRRQTAAAAAAGQW